MTLDEDERRGFESAARPLIEWLNENTHQNVVAVVRQDGAELLEGIVYTRILDYIKD